MKKYRIFFTSTENVNIYKLFSVFSVSYFTLIMKKINFYNHWAQYLKISYDGFAKFRQSRIFSNRTAMIWLLIWKNSLYENVSPYWVFFIHVRASLKFPRIFSYRYFAYKYLKFSFWGISSNSRNSVAEARKDEAGRVATRPDGRDSAVRISLHLPVLATIHQTHPHTSLQLQARI